MHLVCFLLSTFWLVLRDYSYCRQTNWNVADKTSDRENRIFPIVQALHRVCVDDITLYSKWERKLCLWNMQAPIAHRWSESTRDREKESERAIKSAESVWLCMPLLLLLLFHIWMTVKYTEGEWYAEENEKCNQNRKGSFIICNLSSMACNQIKFFIQWASSCHRVSF